MIENICNQTVNSIVGEVFSIFTDSLFKSQNIHEKEPKYLKLFLLDLFQAFLTTDLKLQKIIFCKY